MTDPRYLVRIEASVKLDIDLYRGGNSNGPRLDKVRDKDVVKFKDPITQEAKVKGLSGGISTFTAPRAENNWWWIKAGTVVPDKLVVTRDTTDPQTGVTHYTIRPAEDMLLSAYIAQLQKFLNVEKLSIEAAIVHRGRWAKE